MTAINAEIKKAIIAANDTNQLEIVTETLGGSTSHDFAVDADASDSNVNTVVTIPSDAGIPTEAQILMIRPVVLAGSTDSDLFIYEDDDRQKIDEVVRITGLSANDNVQTFQPGGGNGVPFLNQNVAQIVAGTTTPELYFTITENSGAPASVYQIRIRYIDVLSP